MWIEIRLTLGDNLVELDRDDSEDSSESNDDEMRHNWEDMIWYDRDDTIEKERERIRWLEGYIGINKENGKENDTDKDEEKNKEVRGEW